MTVGWTRAGGLIGIGFALCFVLLVVTGTELVSAESHWPTPPPGPKPPAARVIDASNLKLPKVPPGATAWVVHPLPLIVPRFPPLPSTQLDFPGGVQIISDAGSIFTTLQIVHEELAISESPDPGQLQEVRKLFDVRAFDHEGKGVTPDFRRPWRLQVATLGLTEGSEDPGRLLLARHDKDRGWVPLVTHYYRSQGTLQALILDVGRFAVLYERRVLSG